MSGNLRRVIDRAYRSSSVGDDERLHRRRETNRKSQQKARGRKETLIARLQEENERLKLQLAKSASFAASHSGTDRSSSLSGVQ